MTRSFRPWRVDEVRLLPPSVRDFVPAGRPAHLVRDIVREELDLGAILSAYIEARGFPPHDPAMMVALLLYADSQGVHILAQDRTWVRGAAGPPSCHGLEPAGLSHQQRVPPPSPDGAGELFVQVLALCQRAGLVCLGHVAVDGTKLRANASEHKAMSHERLVRAEAEPAAEVKGWLDKAGLAETAEDAGHGSDRRGDETPDWRANKQQRLARIRAARAELEAEAKAAADAQGPLALTRAPGPTARRASVGAASPPGTPEPTAQRSFTDPESRIVLGRDGFIQGYNGQAAVDSKHQIIVAHRLTQSASDQDGLLPRLDATAANAGRLPDEVSADNGFRSEANLAGPVARGVRGYVPTGRARRPAEGKSDTGPLTDAMRRRLRQEGHRSPYRLRKHIVEPVFGQIRAACSAAIRVVAGRQSGW